MKNILVVANRDKNIPEKNIEELVDCIIKEGCNASVVNYVTKGDNLCNIDLIVVLGGDGTIIEAARATSGLEIPIFGINYGKIGYLADAECGEVGLVKRVLNGDSRIEKRMTLDVTVLRSGKVIACGYHALNDVVLSNGPVPHLLNYDLYCNGRLAQTIRSDGMVIATPTGSSAYSMSAGGPVLDPEMSCIVATPICPHSLHIRPVVFNGESVLEIKNARCRNNQIYLSVDGKETAEICEGDTVRIEKSSISVPLVRVKDRGFLNVLFSKLSEKEN